MIGILNYRTSRPNISHFCCCYGETRRIYIFFNTTNSRNLYCNKTHYDHILLVSYFMYYKAEKLSKAILVLPNIHLGSFE
jgi:hypothetical protein